MNFFSFGHVVKSDLLKIIFNRYSYQLLFSVEIHMSKPQSIKIQPWTDFPKQPYSLFTDDFCHSKLVTVKVNSKSQKSTVNVKANISAEKSGLVLSDEVKFWFPVSGNISLYSKIKSNNYLKLHYDNGVFEKWNSKWNLYATLNTNKSLENISVRFGAGNKSQRCHSDNRFRIDFGTENKQNLTWYHRTVLSYDKITFGVVAAFGISQRILLKNNLLFGYKVNDTTNASLRVENNGYRKGFDWANFRGYFDNAIVDIVVKNKQNIEYGLEGVFNVNGKGSPFEEAILVVKHQNAEKNHTAKVKVSSKFDVSVAYKYPSYFFKNISTATVGVHGSNLLNDKRSFKFGVQAEFNV